jgi:spore coat polysaccharide biosynthesis predicted glycosyltransferase SpsG
MGQRLLSGPRYAILSDVHRATSNRALQTRTKLLLSMGGADPHRVTPRIAPILRSALANSEVLHRIESCHAVLGPAFPDPNRSIADSLTRSGWQVHRALDSSAMARLMSESRIAVMGFGTSLTELAWHGTPHLSVTHHAADEASARSLEARGIGTHLGYAGNLDDAVIGARFRRAVEDPIWQHDSSRKAFDALEGGHGADKILDRLELLDRAYFVSSPSTRNSVSTT